MAAPAQPQTYVHPSQPAHQRRARFVVRLRGLPWECTDDEIRDFFMGLDIVALKIVLMPYGRSSGEGLVEFANEESFRMALGKHKEKIGRRYIEVNRSRGQDMDRALGIEPEGPQGAVNKNSYVIKIRGLPFSALEDEVLGFFGKKGLRPLAIHMVRDELGRATGFAYCEFNTYDEQQLALTLNREYIGQRYVQIEKSTVRQLDKDVTKGLPLGVVTGGLGAPPRDEYGKPIPSLNPDGQVGGPKRAKKGGVAIGPELSHGGMEPLVTYHQTYHQLIAPAVVDGYSNAVQPALQYTPGATQYPPAPLVQYPPQPAYAYAAPQAARPAYAAQPAPPGAVHAQAAAPVMAQPAHVSPVQQYRSISQRPQQARYAPY